MGEYSVDIDGELYLGREPSNLENPPSNQQESVKPESTADIIAEWLTERKTNCERIAAMKTVEDREGWLDDAAGFAAAIKIIADHDRDIKALDARCAELERYQIEANECIGAIQNAIYEEAKAVALRYGCDEFYIDGSGSDEDESALSRAEFCQAIGLVEDKIAEQAKTIEQLTDNSDAVLDVSAVGHKIAEQAATIIRQRASIDLLDTLPDAHLIAEQAKTIERLKNMAVGLATSWAQAWEQTSPTDTAWKDAYDQALRDRHVIVISGIDAALKEARDQ